MTSLQGPQLIYHFLWSFTPFIVVKNLVKDEVDANIYTALNVIGSWPG